MTRKVGGSEKDAGRLENRLYKAKSCAETPSAKENDFADCGKLRACGFFQINIAPGRKKNYVTGWKPGEIVKVTGPRSAYLVYINITIVNCRGSYPSEIAKEESSWPHQKRAFIGAASRRSPRP
jgi:hypothetical protein